MRSAQQSRFASDVAGTIRVPAGSGSGSDLKPPRKVGEMELLGSHLHAMCQPLTAMQCRLEIGLMLGTLDGYEESVTDSLRECERLSQEVRQMRQLVGRALERT